MDETRTISKEARQARNEYMRAYRAKNRERINEQARKRYAADRERFKEYQKKYWIKRAESQNEVKGVQHES